MLIRIAGTGIHKREVFGVDKLRALPLDWYGYTNLELIQPGAMPKQVDVVIVLEDRIVIADLKDWHGTITSDGQHWLQNGRVKDPSPVAKILENARIVATLLRNHTNPPQRGSARDSGRLPTPLIEGCVIMTAPCDISGLPPMEKARVFKIDEFSKFMKNPTERSRVLAPSPWLGRNPRLTADRKWRERLDSFFAAPGKYFKPMEKKYGDYKVVSDAVFEHPKAMYAEYDVEDDLPPIFSPRIMRLSPGLGSLTQPL